MFQNESLVLLGMTFPFFLVGSNRRLFFHIRQELSFGSFFFLLPFVEFSPRANVNGMDCSFALPLFFTLTAQNYLWFRLKIRIKKADLHFTPSLPSQMMSLFRKVVGALSLLSYLYSAFDLPFSCNLFP